MVFRGLQTSLSSLLPGQQMFVEEELFQGQHLAGKGPVRSPRERKVTEGLWLAPEEGLATDQHVP